MADRKNKKSFKTEFKEPVPIKKQNIKETKQDRINKLNQLRKNKLDTTLLQKRGIIDKDGESTINSINATNLTALIDCTEYTKSPILCVLIALNEEADLKKATLDLYSLFEKDNVSIRCGENLFTGLVPLNIVKGKERITLVNSDRSIISALDYAKAADIIVFVSSCKAKHDIKLIKKDPYSAVNVIDEIGYETISAIKAQGLLQHICLIQDLDDVEEKYRNDIKKLYVRYFEGELTPNKIISLGDHDDYKSVIRTICNIKSYDETFNLRKHRTYMLCDTFYAEKSTTNPNETNLVVKGYVKGNTLTNLNYVHLTGFGDFIALEVNDEIEDPVPVSHIVKRNPSSKKDGNNSLNKSKLSQSLSNMNIENSNNNIKVVDKNNKEVENDPEAQGKGNLLGKPVIIDDEFKVNKLYKQSEQKYEDLLNKEIDELIDFNIDGKEEDISFHEDEEEKLIKDQEILHQGYSKKHEAKTSLYYRTPEDMEVADEVDTPISIPCRELFKKYRGLSSMATGSWNPSINLPVEYSKIYSFENIRHTFKLSVKEAHENGLRISGKYVKITLKNFKDFHLLTTTKPLILSTLLKHERKLCIMHLKVNLRENYNEPVYSKQLVEIQIGFRRIISRPIYSTQVGETDKLKKERKIEPGKSIIATLYSQLSYPETPVIFLRPETSKNDMKQIAIGKTIHSDCNKILIKRIVLTGYPLKIHKKKAVIRYMFFNPEDVNYFKPIPIFTKNGLRGNITESLGTHGYMKCMFNDGIKANDTVCLALFKRVFPVWFNESWRLALGYSNDPKYYEIFKQDTEQFSLREAERYKVPDEEELKDDIEKVGEVEVKSNNMMLDL